MTALAQAAETCQSDIAIKNASETAETISEERLFGRNGVVRFFKACGDRARQIWLRMTGSIQKGYLIAMAPVFKLNFKKSQDQSSDGGPFANPIENLRQGKSSLPWILLILVVAGAAAALGYLYFNEMALNQQISSRLLRAEKSERTLKETVEQLNTELGFQAEEINRLSADLQVSNAKAGMITELQKAHREEIDRIAKLYEDQIHSLRRILETRDGVIQTLESNLKVIRRILEGGAVQGAIGLPAAEGFVEGPGIGRAREEIAAESDLSGKPGRVLLVNQLQRYFIVDIGPAEGARIDRAVHVYQKGRFLGEGKIERVYQTLSAVAVISDDLIGNVKTGDAVYFTL